MGKTLYVTDLDGTLLNTKDKVSSFSIQTINSLVDKGMLFTYATARSLVSASVVTEGLSTNIPVIAYNGAFIFQPSTGEILSMEGFTDEERAKFGAVLNAGFIDTFRYFYPEQADIYSWWSYRMQARSRNAGWRIDYFVASERLKDRLADAKIHTEVLGSDHCPVELELRGDL